MTNSCSWTPLGTAAIWDRFRNLAVSGPVLAIAVDPTNTDVVYIGTKAGGVWKSTDAGRTWSPKTDRAVSLACGAIAIDPRNPRRIFVGTGVFNEYYYFYYPASGILRSDDGGETWTELGAATLARAEISRIAIDPTDGASRGIYVASSIGVFESVDGGVNWRLLLAGMASDLVLVPEGTSQVKLLAALMYEGLWTSTRTAAGWSPWSQIIKAGGRIALGQCLGAPKTVYALYAEGAEGWFDNLALTTDGGVTWSPVTVRLNQSINLSFSGGADHSHGVSVPASDLTSPPGPHTYRLSSGGSPPHTHTITLTATQTQDLAMGRRVWFETDPDASGHVHRDFLQLSWGSAYVAVHPTNPRIIYLGETGIWRNTEGGGVFEEVSRPVLPYGQRAFAIDPANPLRVWAANNYGIYCSEDGGSKWVHCNRDLATLRYAHVSAHPQWETVMLGASSTGLRYTGSATWESIGVYSGGPAADIVTAISPSNPQRMYLTGLMARSDQAGDRGSWRYLRHPSGRSIDAFILDPANPDVCYSGSGGTVWRSADAGENWQPIAAALRFPITALAVDPSDTDRVYAATMIQGRVYRIQRTGATWSPPDVTVSDISANLPDPVGFDVSALAVDTTGALWLTVGTWRYYRETGFGNDHVYRLPPGGTTWESRSNGLAQANPINTIVIDPTNDNGLFCGGDVGVFRTDDGGLNWVPWDQGLPNAPVLHLAIHGPRRLLRAATWGRGVWERPIDATTCPLVDLYLRDSILDSGRVTPSPSGHPHPLAPSETAYWYQSVDVKVDTADPAYQTTLPVTDYLGFAVLEHRTPRRRRVNRVYVQVHNRGPQRATGARVRAFHADASAGLPPLPADFWLSGHPFEGTPDTTDWRPVGSTIELGVIEPAEPAVAMWEWVVPSSAAEHSCILVLATCGEDPLHVPGTSSVDWLVPNEKRVTLKNVHVEDALVGTPWPITYGVIEFNAATKRPERCDLVVDWGSLPRGARVYLALERVGSARALKVAPAGLRSNGVALARERRGLLPAQIEGRCGIRRRFDTRTVLTMKRGDARFATVPGLELPAGRPLGVAFRVELPKNARPGEYQFDILQHCRKRVVGGSSYRLRVARRR
jgi:photosystem II stability/assembly factor-like uncharacterized protein